MTAYEFKEPAAPVRAHTIARKPIATTSTYEAPSAAKPPTNGPNFAERTRILWRGMGRKGKSAVIFSLLALIAIILGVGIGYGTRSKTQNLPLPNGHGGPFTGDLTYYEPALGACGLASSSAQNVVAIAHSVFDAAQTGSDPNQNPLCGKFIRAKRTKEGAGERSVDLVVVDRCTGCEPTDIDVSLSVFKKLADQDLGRVTVEWNWL